MRVGTPGFNGARLREAREARSFSAIALSEVAQVSTQAIYHYENGKTSPSPDVLVRISSAMNLPTSFFLLSERSPEPKKIFYRSMSSATKGARNRAERRFEWLRDIVAYLSEFVVLPDTNFPDLELPSDPHLLTDQEIEDAAEAVRKFWNMGDGPIANMVLLLENQGAIVARDELGAATLDSLSTFVLDENRAYVSLGTDKGTAVRWRFDAAHELGHLILHNRLDRNLLSKPEQFKKIEAQAHRFASAFLLPVGPFSKDLYGLGLDSLRAIKPKWKVSIGMMIKRARHAELISDDAERRMWISYNRRKWRTNEPYDDSLEVEEPRVLRRAFELLLDKGEQTPDDVVARLALSPTDVETLSGLPRGFLSEHSRVALVNDRHTEGRVIQFGRRRLSN
jgi:Zn-dependent peptidase ImmA (M78 family)/DNA-binding XRE family transcriptional regulator